MVDDQLLWKNHVDTTIAKVSKGIGMIRRMKPYVPKYTLMHVYNALIMAYFDYCSLAWDTCSNYLIKNLQNLQNRAARVISGKTYEIRSREILSDLGWQPLEKRMKFKKAAFMYNIKHINLSKALTFCDIRLRLTLFLLTNLWATHTYRFDSLTASER